MLPGGSTEDENVGRGLRAATRVALTSGGRPSEPASTLQVFSEGPTRREIISWMD
jgi:hypothetical protein